jgi:predicted methyltransferase MtxX (methanogen marker protein 4)
MATESHALIAVGLEHTLNLRGILQSLSQAQEKGYARLLLIAERGIRFKAPSGIRTVKAESPARLLVEMLSRGEVDGVVRGSVSATRFLAELRRAFQVKEPLRVALLYLASERECFLAPVGVDEGETLTGRIKLLEAGVRLHHFFGLKPKI